MNQWIDKSSNLLPGCFAFLAFLIGPMPAWAQDVAERLELLNVQIRTEEALLEDIRRETGSVFESLDSAEATLRKLDEAVLLAKREEKVAADRLLATQLDLDATRDAYLAQLDLLSPRLRALQKFTGNRESSLLFSARSFSQFLRRKQAIRRVLEGDLQWLDRARTALDILSAREAELEIAQENHRRKVQETLAHERAARQQRDTLQVLYQRLLEERGLREKTLAELESAQQKLRAYLDAFESERQENLEAPDLFAENKGGLVFPVQGFIEVGFGKIVNPKFNTVTFQNGLDIRSNLGTPVRAVAPGKVVHAAPFRGYGNLVILDHGDGYHSLYAHLNIISCKKDTDIERGGIVGEVGETGSLKGSYLYFELRKKGKPIDPKNWFGEI